MRQRIKEQKQSVHMILYVLFAFVVAGVSSCKNDDIESDSYYTFTGETLGQYLENRPETYSAFSEVLKRCKLKAEGSTLEALMNAYGSFTCFAPNNTAMEKYLERYGWSSVAEMPDSAISVISKMHIINSSLKNTIYETKNFASKLADQNMYNKTVYIASLNDRYNINEMANILEKDLLVHNGVIHQVDSVIEPSDLMLDGFLERYPEYSLFRAAVNLTNVAMRLYTEPEDRTFTPAEKFTDIDGGTAAITPQNRYFYFTCFIETNEVLANAGITDLTSMQNYAKEWFENAYADSPDVLESGLTQEWTDSSNYFNRFIAYHFVNKKIDKTDFTYYGAGMANNYERYQEYAETLAPGQLLYMAAGKNSSSDGIEDFLQLNPSADQVPLTGIDDRLTWSHPARNGVLLSTTTTRESSNGLFHELEEVLTFPRRDFKKMRFRFDYASLFPEIMSNAIRAKYTTGQNIFFKEGYLTNVRFRTDGTRLYYLNPNSGASGTAWSNYQGDEMMAKGNFDFDVKLPPVPAGQYEIRFGYTANGNRGCAQIYMGESPNNLIPSGIPVDLTVSATSYGWTADVTDDMMNYESDKILRANGWMKGPNSTLGANGRNSQSLRQISSVIRCVVGVINLNSDGNIYLRFRNATTNEEAQFMMDYIEVCPATIYDNPNTPEPRD